MAQQFMVGDFAKNQVLTNLKCNKDETYGLFFSNRPDLENDIYEKELYCINLSDLKINKVNTDWVPDDYFICDNQIYFTRYISGETHIYKFNLKNNTQQLIKVIPFKVKELFITNNSIYFTITLSQSNNLNSINLNFEIPKYKNFVSSTITYLFETKLNNNIYILLSDKELDIDQLHFDLSNNTIVYSAFLVNNIKSIESNIYTFDTKKCTTTKWTDDKFRIGYIGSLSNNHLIFMGIDLRKHSRNDNQDHYIINKDTGSIELLTPYKDMSNERPGIMTDTCYSTSSPVLSKDGTFYHITVDRYNETLRSIDIDGKINIFDTGLTTIDSYHPLKSGLLVIGLNNQNLHELYLLRDNKINKLSNFNNWLSDYNLSKPIYVEGDIDGWVIPPVNYNPNKKYPGVLMIHGGPKTIYTDVIANDMQLLAGSGYYVFYCNPRGSDGKGNDFSNIRGNFGAFAYKDIMSFVDRVLSKNPSIDETRLGVTGGSYGGYMTNLIITKTDRFKAAVSERGISNITTAFLSSDIGIHYTFEYMGNKDTPWTNKSLYEEASPLSNAHKVTTPTLFNHGVADVRCHYLESLNMYKAILFNGIETKLNLYDGQNHRFITNGKPSSRYKRYTELLNWFDIYLKEEL